MDDFESMISERALPEPRVRRALREATGVGLGELAAELRVHRTALYRWERGDREPRGANRSRYAAFLGAARTALREQ